MDILLLALLAGAIAWLWRRVDTLELTVARLQAERDARGRGAAAAPLADAAEDRPDMAEPAQPAQPARSAIPRVVRDPMSAPAPASPLAKTETDDATAPVDQVADNPLRTALRWRPSFDFEDLFGRLLPIWAGGVTLAVAGFFLVRWSIDAGLLTPPVRVVLAGLFGLALIAGAEVANRWRERVADPRVAQALAGAGLATLYAAFYLAGSQYGLIGSTLAFVGLALVTAAAIALSYRFGLPCAVLGLVGGFAAPALVGGEEANLPLLTLYLGLVTAGLTLTGKRQDRVWLGMASLAGGLGWGALLLMGAVPQGGDLVVLGAYLVLLGAILPTLTGGGGRLHWLVRVGAAAIAALQLAALVHQGGYGVLEWGLYLLLGAALAWFGWRSPAMREGNAVAAAVGVALLSMWPDPAVTGFAAVAVVLAIIFAAVPLAQIWRGHGRTIDFAQANGVALGLAAASYWQFGHFLRGESEPLLALASFALALIPAMAVWLGWSPAPHTRRIVGAGASATALAGVAGLMVLPAWAAPLVAPMLVGGVLALRRPENGWLAIARGAAVIGLLLALFLPQTFPEMIKEAERAIGMNAEARWTGVVRWLAVSAAFAALAWREMPGRWRLVSEALAALAGYVALAQVLPADALAWSVAVAAAVLAWRLPRPGALAALLGIAGLWAIPALIHWLDGGVEALVGIPLQSGDLPALKAVALHIVPLVAALSAAMATALQSDGPPRRAAMIALGVAGTVALHTAYRHAFAAAVGGDFVATGMMQRTVWEAVLLGAAWLAARESWQRSALSLALAGLAHFGWFTLILHNPLWAEQAVGAWPVIDALLPAYAIGLLTILFVQRHLPQYPAFLRWAADAAAMAVIALYALSELRHLFAGSLPVAGTMGQSEDLLRSLLGIVLAVGFLWWGSRSQQRSWRIGSLVLMVLAVAKVFLVDTAGLGGLARIASFMALGFSLIGIGWFYSRQLRGSGQTDERA
ncbi:DUF2339 domain-containing protein [Tsuneonella suprasediminis]|uniref:DUF2339 domain-containing protein n=1 Tax=Tsuneonella suprasediminis TaxID=2306996 RepID=A0A419R2C9_9SPHN|nr:DUF2339 domain-containing protein [Tsuneonella suprasediminis]RJX68127.1 DUF2339 domain-containing protein [Tsuneonella suprasediminis]